MVPSPFFITMLPMDIIVLAYQNKNSKSRKKSKQNNENYNFTLACNCFAFFKRDYAWTRESDVKHLSAVNRCIKYKTMLKLNF